MEFITLKMDSRGRITIPDKIRKKLDLKRDDTLFIKEEKDYLVIYPRRSIKIKLPK